MPTVVTGLDGLRRLQGADLGASRWLEITQDRIAAFADATDDHQWIHVDEARAKTSPFGGTIAHGHLTLALVIPLWTELVRIEGISMAVNYGLNRVRLPAPVPAGSKIRLHARVPSVVDVTDDVVQLTAECTIELAGSDKPAVVAEAVYRYYS